MTQRDRDRLVVLKKAQKRLITQSQAAQELSLTPRQVKRLLRRLREEGDKAVVHGLRGRPSNRALSEAVCQQAVAICRARCIADSAPPWPASTWRRSTA